MWDNPIARVEKMLYEGNTPCMKRRIQKIQKDFLPVRTRGDLCNGIKDLEDRSLENSLKIEQYFRQTGGWLRSLHPSPKSAYDMFRNLPMTRCPLSSNLLHLILEQHNQTTPNLGLAFIVT